MNRSKVYKHHRFPPEIIQHTVCLYHRFNLSHRDIEDMLAKRGMRKFKSMRQARGFFGAHATVYNLLNLGRHLVSAENYRYFRLRAFASWNRAVAV